MKEPRISLEKDLLAFWLRSGMPKEPYITHK